MTDLGQKTERRRRRARRLVALALAVTFGAVIAVYWRMNSGKEKAPPAAPVIPRGVHQQLSGFTFTRSQGGQQVFTIHADRTLAYKKGGATVLDNVYAEFFGLSGNRHDILRTRRGVYNSVSGDLSTSADVEIELNAPPEASAGLGNGQTRRDLNQPGPRSGRQPARLETSRVTYRNKGSLLETPAPVRFRVGPVAGSGVGMTYATRDGWLVLEKQVEAVLKRDQGPRPEAPIQLSASRLRYNRNTGEVDFWGPVEIHQAGRTATAARAQIFLNGKNQVTRAAMEGQVRVAGSSPQGDFMLDSDRLEGTLDPDSEQLRVLAAQGRVRGKSSHRGNVSRLQANEFRLRFDGDKPESGRAAGNVLLRFDSLAVGAPSTSGPKSADTAKSSGEELSTNELLFTLRPGRTTLRDAETTGAGKLTVFPQDPRVGRRTVTAGRFEFTFDARNRLKTLLGTSQTQVVFEPPQDSRPGSAPARTSAERLTATFDPATETLRSVNQTGNFRFHQADQQATAGQADYSATDDTLTLTGHPVAWDATTRAQAERITIDQRADTVDGVGKVQATSHDPKVQSTLPSNILADRMTANRKDQIVHYEGHVRAWRGSDVLESTALEMDRKNREVRAGPQVVSSYLGMAGKVVGVSGSGAAKLETDPVTIRADHLDYSDSERKATYRGKVVLQTRKTLLRADRLDVYLSEAKSVEGSEVERAVAEGGVEVTQPGRRATGERAEYVAQTGKIVLTGGPPTLYDAARGVTTGRRLTFFTRDDSLLVDGGYNSTQLPEQRVAQ